MLRLSDARSCGQLILRSSHSNLVQASERLSSWRKGNPCDRSPKAQGYFGYPRLREMVHSRNTQRSSHDLFVIKNTNANGELHHKPLEALLKSASVSAEELDTIRIRESSKLFMRLSWSQRCIQRLSFPFRFRISVSTN